VIVSCRDQSWSTDMDTRSRSWFILLTRIFRRFTAIGQSIRGVPSLLIQLPDGGDRRANDGDAECNRNRYEGKARRHEALRFNSSLRSPRKRSRLRIQRLTQPVWLKIDLSLRFQPGFDQTADRLLATRAVFLGGSPSRSSDRTGTTEVWVGQDYRGGACHLAAIPQCSLHALHPGIGDRDRREGW
jgi:hypothetical protein